MTIHLIKLCVGADTIADLRAWQRHVVADRAARGEKPFPTCTTRQTPKRKEDLLAGGSLYWVIKGVIQVRQAVLGVDNFIAQDGRQHCALILDSDLVETQPAPRKPFQGWRYLDPADAPADLASAGDGGDGGAALPETLRRELIELGAW